MDTLISIEKTILESRNVGVGLRMLRQFTANHRYINVSGRLDDIEDNYGLMKEFMLNGYKDAKNESVYNDILKQLYNVLIDIKIQMKVLSGTAMANIRANSNVQFDNIRFVLEKFVEDVAMLSLEEHETVTQRKNAVYSQHQEYMNALFNTILVSSQWSDGTAKFYEELLISPTIDANDCQLLVSAITLSAMNFFEVNKIYTLINVYTKATDENIRQRALVGFVFSLPNIVSPLLKELENKIANTCANEAVRKDLLELQMQIFYCLNTERDNDTIQKEIIPTLVKGNNFRITQFGIEEKEEDSLNEILNPGASDKAMEEMEQSFNKMLDMQKAGSDIYFGGFSHMKRFPFFYKVSNWFCPFYAENPSLQGIKDNSTIDNFMQTLLNHGPFCDSDKYSFALAISGIVDKMPASMAEMLSNGAAFKPRNHGMDKANPAYIRRMYLQDLYRFFRLYNYKNEFINPFIYDDSDNKVLFFVNKLFVNSNINDSAKELERFFIKRKLYNDALKLATSYGDLNSTDGILLRATIAQNQKKYAEAQQLYETILSQEPDNFKALQGAAPSSFHAKDYVHATEYYAKLHKIKSDNRNYAMNMCVSQINNDEAKDAVAILYKLTYEYPEDTNIKSILGWGHIVLGQYDLADKIYTDLLSMENPLFVNYLNAGYCKWLNGKVREAVQLFKTFLSQSNASGERAVVISKEFEKDFKILKRNEISEIDVKLMTDIVNNKY